MHELSIAMSIADMAQEESAVRGGCRVLSVHLRIGRLAGIVHDALRSSYQMATEGTELEGSSLVIEDVPVLVQCPVCDARRPVAAITDFRCAVCGTPTSDVVEGRELLVTALEIGA